MRRDRDDDDDDDDDRPRKKRRPVSRRPRRKAAGKSGVPVGLILGLVGGGVLLLMLAGVGVGVYFATRKPPANATQAVMYVTPPAGGGPPIAVGGLTQTGWVNFRQPDGLYSATVPSNLSTVNFTELKPFGEDQVSTLLTLGGGMGCNIEVKVLSPNSLTQRLKQEEQEAKAPPLGLPPRVQVNWLGRVVTEESSPNEKFGKVKRTFRDGNKTYSFEISSINRTLTDADKAKFFDSVVLGGR